VLECTIIYILLFNDAVNFSDYIASVIEE